MPSAEFQNAIAEAMNFTRTDDIIDGVKSAVITELEALDPSVEIRKTDYFNHSFAPDFVLKWGKKQKRDVYIRYSLKSTQAARDLELLGREQPVFISLDSGNDDSDSDVTERISEDVRQNPGSLVTNVPAIDSLTPSSTALALESGQAESVTVPLMSLFRRSVVKGGRGLIVPETADRLQQVSVDETTASEVSYAVEFASIATEVLRPDAAVQLKRASELIRVALTGDVTILNPSRDDSQDDQVPPDVAQLTQEEVLTLLPYLLRKSRSSIDPLFWRHLGQMLTLQQIESMSVQLAGLEISDFVRANLSRWRGTKAVLSINADAIDAVNPITPSWFLDANMLCAVAGVWKVHFTTDRRRGSTREDSPLARWNDIRPALRAISLSGIELQSVTRRVKLSASDQSNVMSDVNSIQSSIKDDFLVRSVDAHPSADDSSDMRLDFAHMAATGINVPLADLSIGTFKVLGHRYRMTTEEDAAISES